MNFLKTFIKNIALEFIIYLILSTATFAILFTILQYATFKKDVGFLLVKQEYLENTVWLTAFYIHVFSSIFTLCAGFTQFSDYVLKKNKKLHKLVGKIYAYDVMCVNFPAGMIMAIYANGHIQSKIAFVILDCLWFWFTYKAVSAIKNGDKKNHRKYMIRSYALTFSAITLRTWKIIFSSLFNFYPLTLYMIDAWMGFVPNLLFAEWYIHRLYKNVYRPR